MKKLLLVGVGMLFMAGVTNAAMQSGTLGEFAGKKIWRSSETATNDDWRLLGTTGNVVVGYVQVSSPGVNSYIQFQKYGSTAPAIGISLFRSFGSTIAANTATTYPATQDGIFLNIESTGGWKYKTAGSVPAILRILWDYKIYPQ